MSGILISMSVLITIIMAIGTVYYYYWIPKNRPFEILGCVLTADDGIINIRFKINRAGYIAKGPHEIYITDETSGIKFSLLSLPKFGKMVTQKGRRGRYGYMMFVNIGYVIKHNAKIAVTIGDFSQNDVSVI